MKPKIYKDGPWWMVRIPTFDYLGGWSTFEIALLAVDYYYNLSPSNALELNILVNKTREERYAF